MRLRWLGGLALVALALGGALVAQAAGPGGWDHVGDNNTSGGPSLTGSVTALSTDAPGRLLVGGDFTNAGGEAAADRIASWDGADWSPVGSASDQIGNGGVFAITYANGKTYAGGSFTNAGGNQDADYLAVWDGNAWAPFCNSGVIGPAFDFNVKALQIVGSTLYVGGEFQNAAGIANADYLVACDLSTGMASSTLGADTSKFFSGPVAALAATSNGVLYAGGRFKVANIPATDNVAYFAGGVWNAMGSGPGACGCAIDGNVRSLTAAGTDVYVGTDVKNVAGIAQADNVARWDGAASAWSAVGADAGGTNGWFPSSTFIYALTSAGSNVYATGSFLDAGGDPTADNVAYFDGSSWHHLGSNGSGNGPWSGEGHGLAIFPATAPRRLYAGGSFIGAGGDSQARSIASFSLAAITPQPTPTVTPGPTPGPTPTVTPGPPPDTTPPKISALLLSRTIFRAAPGGAAFRAARAGVGAVLSFRLSEPGSVRFTIERPAAGRTVKGRCVKPTRSNRGRHRCVRWVAVKGSFTFRGRRGSNRITFRGRIGGKRLRPGSYRLNARVSDRAKNRSRTKRTAFRIVR
jgi:hypothetical protein